MFQQNSFAAERPADVPVAPNDAAPTTYWLTAVAIGAVLWRRKAWIIGTTIVALLATLLFVLVVPPKFVAVTQILLDPSDLRVVDNSVTPASQASDANVAQIESQVRVLTSDTVLRRMIASEGLDRDPEFVGGQLSFYRSVVRSVRAVFGFEFARHDEDPTLVVLRELRKRIYARRAERTYVVDLSIEAGDPDKAARLANAIALAYLEEQTAARSEAARRASGSLTGRLAELQDRVRRAEERAEHFKTQNNIVGASGQLVNEQQLSEISNQLIQARARTGDAKSRYDQIERLRRSGAEPGAIAEAVQSATVAALRTQYAEIVRREAELTAKLGARHPSVTEIHAQARDLRRLINEEIARIGQAAYNDLERARASEAALAASLEAIKRESTATNEALVRLRELQREVDASRAVYEAFLVRARETGEQQRLDTTNVRVISKAEPPQYRSSPPRNLVLIIAALFLGVGAGTGLAFFRERTDDRIYSPVGLESMSGLPVLAVLPDLNVSRRRWEERGPAAVPAEGAPRFAPELRALRDVFGPHGAKSGASVLLLSAGDAAGKTTVALSMAFAAAAAGQKVLLVDGDTADRTLSQAVAGRCGVGLADVLDGRLPLQDAMIRDPQTGLHVLPVVAPKGKPARPIEAADIRRLLAQAKAFDVVLFDGPADPRAATVRSLADAADHIVITATGGATRAKDVSTVMSVLESHAGKVRGTMMADAVKSAA
jgi:uncharacterized protein involved in exopolysaccharide biosynthesis/Mrp family chromosome partitioning ATPase